MPGQTGFCIAGGTTDTGEDADADTTDVPDDIAGDVEDIGDDIADASDAADGSDADPDAEADAVTDVVADVDASDDADVAPDADVEDDADAEPDADVEPDVVEVDRDPYLGWIAYHVVNESSPVERIHLIAGDGSRGPYVMPSAWEFGGTKYATFSPDGTHLAYSLAGETGPAVRVITLADGTFEDVLDTGDFASVRFPRWSPDGTQMLFLGKTMENRRVWNIGVMDVASGDVTMLTDLVDADVSTEFVSAGSWNHDSSKIFFITGTPGQGQPSDVWVMNADGTGAEAVSSGLNPTSLILSIRPDGTEALFDSGTHGQPVRMGILNPPPPGGLAYGGIEFAGMAGADSSCAYYGNADQAVCTRLQTSAFENCFTGGVDCTQDIVVVDLATGESVRNISQSIDARDGFAAVSLQPYTEISVVEFE